MYQRKQITELKNRLKGKKNLIQVITGPRQVGKTTLALQLTEQITIPNIFVSADTVQSTNSFWIQQ
ncbi:MAG: AAA family ATPase, partial [Ignavibacteria bacterium]|nr:AAA family ATPase [Ignavibacteria bacterium]